METADLFSRLAVALGIGLLFGLERGWKQREDAPGSRTAGIRTFALIGLLGGIVGTMARGADLAGAGGIVLAVALGTFFVTFALACRDENRSEGVYSATTAIAGMVAFSLGAYAQWGDLRVVAAGGVAAVVVLASREALHGLVRGLTWPELRAGIVLLVMTFIALPLMPDAPVGPFGGIKPRDVWLLAIVLAAVSFVGYAAVKYMGETGGTLLAAAAGALVSSTAVTVTNARRSAMREGSPQVLAAGAVLATAVSLARVIVLVAALNPALLSHAAPALLAAMAVTGGFAYGLAFRRAREPAKASPGALRNPFELRSALLFALVLGLMVIVGRAASERFGATGAFGIAAAGGLADVDAITIAIAQLAPAPLASEQAARAILLAVAVNTASKATIAIIAGSRAFRLWVLLATAAAFVAAGAAVGLTVAASAAWG
ncbi:MAG TPA: DUF4010 domain-containing protein [Xanthobacteraceae bacterium]|nr:DUF4010 domain-containing protein [Xanthobacteraceae bacterium]